MFTMIRALIAGGGLYLKAGLAAVAVLAIVIVYNINAQRLIQKGFDRALKAVEAQNQAAKEAAGKVQKKVDDCYNRDGWAWNVVTGKCEEEAATP